MAARSKHERQSEERAGREGPADEERLAGFHLRLGWWSLLLFLTLGIALEGLHAFKAGWYLDVGNEARRFVLRLAHAHGTLLALVNICFALTLKAVPGRKPRSRRVASRCLVSATVLLPGGFFLGGLFIYGGDPGLGVWLVPLGAVLLFLSVLLTARTVK